MENSSDLSSGRPMSESDAFFLCTASSAEIWPRTLFTFLRKVLSFWEFHPTCSVITYSGWAQKARKRTLQIGVFAARSHVVVHVTVQNRAGSAESQMTCAASSMEMLPLQFG